MKAAPPTTDHKDPLKRHGRQRFDEEVHAVTKTRIDNLNGKLSLQLSVALVLRSGSGVGKTYATQTARYGSLRLQEKRKEEAEQQKQPYEDCPYDLYSAYIGFNVGERLKSEEEEYMQRMRSAEGVAVVVLTRLLAWLAAFRPEGEDWDAVVQPQYPVADAAVAAMPYAKMHGDTTVATRRLLLEKVEGCLRALADARKAAGQKPLALLVAVDEGQELDELAGCEPDSKGGGARWALRVLRELQRTALSCGVALLPICTGINPEVSLGDGTGGKNVVLGEAGAVVMLPNEWKDFCEERLGKKTEGFVCRPAVHAFYALLWPRARHVANITSIEQLQTEQAALVWDGCDARAVLKAAADQVKHAAPQNMVRYGDVPVVDYCMLTHFSQALSLQPLFNAAPLDIILMQAKPLSLVDLYHTVTQHDAFEAFAFNVFVAFAVYFYHEQPDQKYVPVSRCTEQLTNWMPKGPATFKFCGMPHDPKHNAHPFTLDRDSSVLSEQFEETLGRLQKMDDAILLHCGGEAKIDFLLLKVIAVDEGSKVCTLTARYADAKHIEPAEAQLRDQPAAFFTGAKGLQDITSKAMTTHTMLTSALPPRFTLSAFQARHVLMVTNKLLRGAGDCVLKEIPDDLQRVVNPQQRSGFR